MSAVPRLPGTLTRVGAMTLRFWYLLRRSWPRAVDLVYWPTVQILLWGFIQSFLMTESSFFAQAFGVLLAAAWLWEVLYRSQLGFSLSFLEEVWSRNLGHLLVSPLRPSEFVLSLMSVSLLRAMIGLVPASLVAYWVFDFSVYSLGLALIAFFLNLLVFGWALAMAITGLVLRYGQGAESLAWALIFAVAPLAGVYYPTDILPDFLGAISAALPPAYIFDGMRALLIDGAFRFDLLGMAAALNAVYLAFGAVAFHRFLESARERGTLMQMGE